MYSTYSIKNRICVTIHCIIIYVHTYVCLAGIINETEMKLFEELMTQMFMSEIFRKILITQCYFFKLLFSVLYSLFSSNISAPLLGRKLYRALKVGREELFVHGW